MMTDYEESVAMYLMFSVDVFQLQNERGCGVSTGLVEDRG